MFAISLHFFTLGVCSTKTRIKTELPTIKNGLLTLWEYVPLKQGLRLASIHFQTRKQVPLGVCSTKTRIKTCCTRTFGQRAFLWEYVPLKQGLRLIFLICGANTFNLWEYVPLKQGLRLSFFLYHIKFFSFSGSMFH